MKTTSFSLRNFPARCGPGRGFTLVELLASITIIALLVALLMGGLRNVQARGRAVKCASNLRQIGIAAQAWSGENNQRVIPAFLTGESGNVADPGNWTGLLFPYMNYPTTITSVRQAPVFVCPENPLRAGYGHNYNYISYYPNQPWTASHWTTYAQVAKPTQTVLIVDNCTVGNPLKWRPFVRPPTMNNLADSVVSFVHPGKTANVLWLDGHVTAERALDVSGTTPSPFMKDDQLWDTN